MAGLTADIGGFLSRLVRLDSGALVRIRFSQGRIALWGRVPWDVLVSRTVAGSLRADQDVPDQDVTDLVVRAGDWLASATPASRTQTPGADVSGLARHDAAWRSPLPPHAREVLEQIPSVTVRGLVAAAADTLRAAEAGGVGGRAVGSRAVRDALLDHVAIVVSAGSRRVDVPQRLVQAVVRMGFVAVDEPPVRVLAAGPWVGLAGAYGTAWWRRPSGLAVSPVRDRVT